MKRRLLYLLVVMFPVALVADSDVPNSRFEKGHDRQPEGWRLTDRNGGDWQRNIGRDGGAAIRVVGKGATSGQWRSEPVKMDAGRCYVFSFWTRGNGSGCVTSGIDDMNVDWGAAGEQWTHRLNVLRTPDRDGAYAPSFHLGQWMMDGEAIFDDLSLRTVRPVYAHVGDVELGHGEQVDGNRYSFVTQYGGVSRNHARTLMKGTASFNSDRWDVGRGSCITYRFALPNRTWHSANVSVTCGHYTKGTADVEISRDGKGWTRLAAITNTTTVDASISSALFPADALLLRVRGNDPCQLQIYRVSFDGDFKGAPMTVVGATRYVDESTGEVVCKTSGCTFFSTDYGEMLPCGGKDVNLWRASSGWKIPRVRALPKRKAEGLSLKTAANEAEAAQLVVCPTSALSDVRVTAAGELKCRENGRTLSASAVEVLRVGYVPVEIPTDEVGCRALWPDPLPPQDDAAFPVAAGENQPFWVRVKPPKGTSKGVYDGMLDVLCKDAKGREVSFAVPISVEVFGFELPDEMTCETAFDFSLGTVTRYHGLKTAEEKRIVAEKYLRSLGDHHISPYDPGLNVNWSVKWKGLEDPMTAEPVFDWTAWDKAVEKALAKYHFNTFLIRGVGQCLGCGNYQKYAQPEFLGVKADNPAYDVLVGKYLRGIERHLEEKGWLSKAFLYAFDEPEPKHYPHVMRIFETVKRHAPKLRRMVTEEAVEALHGGPNLWTPLTPNLHVSGEEKARAAGDAFWWYVCCGPKAPYVTEFIDHPGTEMRLWLWQTWGEDVAGILIWTTTWWTSANAYPDPAHPQNPYEDTMSWCESDSLGKGAKSPWGNGDGRFLYPPRTAAQPSPTPILDGPVDSYRIEMLRDGIEDYEYFAMLKRLLADRRNLPPTLCAEAEALLAVPKSVYSSLTEFTTDPEPMETHREKLACAIEKILMQENPSFEAGLEGWGKASNVSIDAAVAHLGTKSACIVVGDPKTENVYITRSVPIEGGCRYRAECFVRTENVRTAEGKDSSVGAGMIIEWADEKGTYLGWGASTYNNFGTRDWFKVESGLLRPPAAATRASVYLCLRGTGKAWFDDFLLEKIDESVPKCSPENGAELTNNTPEFTWKSCAGVTNYVLRLSQNPSFAGDGVLEHNVGGFTRFQLERPLAPGIWYWKVCAAGMEDREAWSFRQTAPVERDCLPPLVKDSAARVVSDKGSFVVRVKDAGEHRPSLTFHGVKGMFAGVDGDGLLKYVFESPDGGWPSGLTADEVLAVDAAGNGRKTPFFLINSAKPENSVVIGKDGRYHEDGKPIFPLGIYEVATNYLAEVKSAGFDVVHLYRWESNRDNMACREYLDACRAAGLRAFVGFDRRSVMADDREHVAQRIAVLASHPALFCWYLYDEPEVTRQFVAPDRLAAVADFIRRLDPHHPVVMSTWGNAAYRRAWDSHWTQAYGNPSEAYRELEKQKLRLGDSPITLLVNCNDDKLAAARRDGKLPPNVKFGRDRDHLRACAFLGIVKGCNGLFWWWFAKDSKWYYSASQCPDAWRDLSAVVHEVAALRSAVASAESIVTGESGTPDARVLWWSGVVGGKRIIIMVNTSENPVSVPQVLGYGPLSLGRYEVKIIQEAACVVSSAAAVEWSLGRNATREDDIITIDTHGKRTGGAAYAKMNLGDMKGGVRATIRARGRGIGCPDKSYFGLKFMFRYIDPETGVTKWPQADHKGGDFDWTTLELVADLGQKPVGMVDVTLGLQNVEGRVEFDLSSFKYVPHTLYEFPRTNQDYKVSYPKHVKERRQLRGAMLPFDPTEEDIKTLASWGGTVGRYQMSRNFQKIDANLDFDEYAKWLDGRLDLLEKVLDWARKCGMMICVDLHVPPGSIRDNSEMRMFTDKACLDSYIRCWEKIARRFKGNTDVIYGYDLLNEPHQNRHAVPYSYWDAQRLAAEAIRHIDPDTTIVMEANWSCSAPAYAYMSPLAMSNVIYQIHMYIPSEYTHQGVHGWSPPVKWPDDSKGWNKEMIRAKLAPVVAFAKRHDAKMYVGEFSAIAWAEGADRYLKDCIELFDEYGWDWCYHAFNEWRGWNVEYAGDSLKTLRRVGDTPRKRVLLDGLKGTRSR